MKYEELITSIIAIIIGSLIASYIDFLLIEDLREKKRIKYEMMMRYGNL